jgi:hypothetical protein
MLADERTSASAPHELHRQLLANVSSSRSPAPRELQLLAFASSSRTREAKSFESFLLLAERTRTGGQEPGWVGPSRWPARVSDPS